MPGPLSHLVILDLSRVLAGLWCAQLLADLGAEVIKIEKPGSRDDTRSWGPPFLKDTQGRDTGEAAYYLACNRGKKSVAIDFTQNEGQAIVRELVRGADIVAVGVPCGPINGLDQVFADPQVHARDMSFELPHRLSATVPQVGNPLHFSATPVAYTQAPPLLGGAYGDGAFCAAGPVGGIAG